MAIVRLIGANKDPIGSMDYEDVVAYKWEPFILGSNKGSYPLLDYLSIMGVQGTKKETMCNWILSDRDTNSARVRPIETQTEAITARSRTGNLFLITLPDGIVDNNIINLPLF